uniref:Uncharacterized protein n=1 Tax=Aegilops tauschii subsp. strangulata TaxID=200361 RepID=A0A453ETS0_AEGTS
MYSFFSHYCSALRNVQRQARCLTIRNMYHSNIGEDQGIISEEKLTPIFHQ